jgi:hypothetical protein
LPASSADETDRGNQHPAPVLTPPFRTIDLNGPVREVTLDDGNKVVVKLLDLKEARQPPVPSAARVQVESPASA